ncbi:MAG: polysaccharide lyase, partial [Candidatus Cyclobacteriaceae bacterium M3_2C_046]
MRIYIKKTVLLYFIFLGAMISCADEPVDKEEIISDNKDSVKVIFKVNFENREPGPYAESDWEKDWLYPDWANHAEGYGQIIGHEYGNCLKLPVKKGSFLFDGSAYQWWTRFYDEYDELYFSYKIYFSDVFASEDLRGKLPGLAGGTGKMSGGDLPDGKTGWSARYMFHSTGFRFYLYHPDNYHNGYYNDPQPVEGKKYYGQSVLFNDGLHYEHSRWMTITQRIVLNTPGQKDGFVEGFIDGRLQAREINLRFRDVPSLAIDKIFFAVFLGGSGDPPSRDGYILFDDFMAFQFLNEGERKLTPIDET